MLHVKYQSSGTLGSQEEDFYKCLPNFLLFIIMAQWFLRSRLKEKVDGMDATPQHKLT